MDKGGERPSRNPQPLWAEVAWIEPRLKSGSETTFYQSTVLYDEGISVVDGTGSDSDTQSPSSSFSGDKLEDGSDDELQTLQFTVPFNDTVPVDSYLPHTQLLDLGDETQLLDYQDGGEVMTQLVNECDDEVLSDSDSQGTNRTQVLTDADDDDSERGIGNDVVELEKKQLSPPNDQAGKDHVMDSDASTDDEHGSASLGDSDAVVGNMTCKGTQTLPNSNLRNSQFGKQRVQLHDGICGTGHPTSIDAKAREVDCDHDNWRCNSSLMKPGHATERMVGYSTARKLFKDDSFAGNKELTCNIDGKNGGTGSHHLLAGDHEFAGLSYVGSQEPGELSQANALDVVDRFVNNVDLSPDVDRRTTSKGKSPPVLNSKGPQSLANKLNSCPVGAVGVYDWIDSREDEGGGNFFTKKKDSFFEKGARGRRSITEPQNSRRKRGGDLIEDSRQKEKGFNLHKKIIGKTKKNLAEELDKQLNVDSREKILEVPGMNPESPGGYAVGFDTQMAAEAMEALFYGDPSNQDETDAHQVTEMGPCLKHVSPKKRIHPPGSGGTMRQSKKKKMLDTKLSKETLTSSRKFNKNRKVKVSPDSQVKPKSKRHKFKSEQCLHSENAVNGNKSSVRRSSRLVRERKTVEDMNGVHVEDAGRYCSSAATNGHLPLSKRQWQEDCRTVIPIAHRTRQCMEINSLKLTGDLSDDCKKGKDGIMEVIGLADKRKSSTDVDASNVLIHAETHSVLDSNQIGKSSKGKVSQEEQQCFGAPHEELAATTSCMKRGAWSYPKGRRTHQNMSRYLNKVDNIKGPSLVSSREEVSKHSVTVQQRQNDNVKGSCIKVDVKRKTRSAAYPCPFLSSAERKAEEKSTRKDLDFGSAGANDNLDSTGVDGNLIPKSQIGSKASMQSGKRDESTEHDEVTAKLEASPSEKAKPSHSPCTTPCNGTPINTASPVCLGNEYPKQSCRKSQSRGCLKLELTRLGATEAVVLKDLRRRRDLTNVRVLFSHHLDEDIIKQQKKILARLGVPPASSSSDATHFVADKFVRTRNMLETIALGKPVVSHLWLESCRQASSFIDEKNYILRDFKKEKEIGFSMPVSLARATQYPLLQGKQVFITPNVKPGKEVIASLVKAVHGQAVERIGRSAFKDDKVPDNMLVLSSEEDYTTCVPFLEKGASIYSSELLLNGIVIQKLEYERHRLFVDHVKRTRSTLWLKKGNQFLPVTKCK
ncbi:hypothetical protein NE237_015700 [Protea cynaroides]|uniref:BRCT domain-containing protein n=1 Tax=Protea cynaroides TaxID=273540 RepID=A0A9Q0QRG7_9MAGN|nr:hypothetical protein NE237_015700 [Protea cynaroides]